MIENQQLRIMLLMRVSQLSCELQKTKHGLKVLQKLQKTYPSVMNSFSQHNPSGVSFIPAVHHPSSAGAYRP